MPDPKKNPDETPQPMQPETPQPMQAPSSPQTEFEHEVPHTGNQPIAKIRAEDAGKRPNMH